MKEIIASFLLLMLVHFANAQNQTQAATATNGTLTVTFSTNNTNTYAAAIYITDSSGNLVNTMLYRTSNGDNSAQDMTTYWSKIGSSWSTSAAKLLTTVDAVTGATSNTAYTAKQLFWGKSTSISAAADGTYTVNFEMANYTGSVSRRYTSGTFIKGPTASSSTVATMVGFGGITIAWTPTNTAINDINLEKQYVAYPNPTRSTVYMSGFDITEIEICTLAGKHIFSTNQQTFNLNRLPKGIYMARVTTKNGTFVKKIEKL